jgi:hypothetical protein
MAENLSRASFYITAGLLSVIYAFYARQLWQKKPGDISTRGLLNNEAVALLRYTLVAVLIMLLSSKVFSPQFLIWLCPLIPIVGARWRYVPLVLFLIAGAITQYIYPHNYIAFELFTPHLVILHALRNLLLVAMAVIYILPMRSSPLKVEEGVVSNHSPV